ncbi:tetratricopeptide repeat protein [Candidatus Saganbacteria bacterium]|nr:tetratricopeptide repeat protein [Candidatus Saganbacteria bacterium]
MKKIFLVLGLLLLAAPAAFAVSFEDMDFAGVSLKAGPTEPIEGLSIAWVEAALYPKNIEKGQEVFVEVKLTSKVKKVVAEFDYNSVSERIELISDNGTNWSKVFKTPEKISTGVHIAKIIIEGKSCGKITRTLDFAVVKGRSVYASSPSYAVSVLKTASVMDEGEIVRQLLPGVKVLALFKAPFYRVVLSDSREGWVEASRVEEPTEQLNLLGYKSFLEKKYKQAENYYLQSIALDPSNVKAHFYLASTYKKLGKEDDAAIQLREVLRADPSHPGARDLAYVISRNYFNRAVNNYNLGYYNSAIAHFKRSLDLVPTMLSAWVKLGETYNKMGLIGDAYLAYTEALRVDPENREVKALLGLAKDSVPVASEKNLRQYTEVAAKIPLDTKIANDFVKDSVVLVQNSKTSKGTMVQSAVKSVLALTRSLGTKISEDGWHVNKQGKDFIVRYVCRQERNGKTETENFDWKVDTDKRSIVAMSENSKLLMNRW